MDVQAGSLEEKFVKFAEMNAQICQDLAKPAGANERATLEELKRVAKSLGTLEDVNTTEENKTRLLRMTTLVADVDALEKAFIKKTSNDPNFKRAVQDIAALHRYIDDLEKKTPTGATVAARHAVERLKKLTTKSGNVFSLVSKEE